MAPRKGSPKREIDARVLETWRNMHPGSVPIPAELAEIQSGGTVELARKFNATGMEVEELEWNQIRTRCPFFHVRCTCCELQLILHLAWHGIQR